MTDTNVTAPMTDATKEHLTTCREALARLYVTATGGANPLYDAYEAVRKINNATYRGQARSECTFADACEAFVAAWYSHSPSEGTAFPPLWRAAHVALYAIDADAMYAAWTKADTRPVRTEGERIKPPVRDYVTERALAVFGAGEIRVDGKPVDYFGLETVTYNVHVDRAMIDREGMATVMREGVAALAKVTSADDVPGLTRRATVAAKRTSVGDAIMTARDTYLAVARMDPTREGTVIELCTALSALYDIAPTSVVNAPATPAATITLTVVDFASRIMAATPNRQWPRVMELTARMVTALARVFPCGVTEATEDGKPRALAGYDRIAESPRVDAFDHAPVFDRDAFKRVGG